MFYRTGFKNHYIRNRRNPHPSQPCPLPGVSRVGIHLETALARQMAGPCSEDTAISSVPNPSVRRRSPPYFLQNSIDIITKRNMIHTAMVI